MNNLILFLLVAFLPLITSAQKKKMDKNLESPYGVSTVAGREDDAPFRGAKKVICLYPDADSSKVLLNKIAQVLVQDGFTIERLDSSFLVLTTDDKELKHVRYSIRAFVSGNILTVTSKWKPTHTVQIYGVKVGESFYDTEYAKAKSNIGNAIFRDILRILGQTGYISLKYAI